MRAVLSVPFLMSALVAQASFVIPTAQTTALGNSPGGFPFSYTQYVRFQQAIGTSHFSGPTLMQGIALRPTTRVLNVPQVQRQSMIVELADCTVAPGALSGTYATNAGTNMTRVFDGAFDIHKPNVFDPLEFSTLIPFDRPYVHTNQRPLLVDLQPTAFDSLPCGSGGNGTGHDGVSGDPDIWSVAGKNSVSCTTPASGGVLANLGFVFRFYAEHGVLSYSRACQGTNGLRPLIGSSGGNASIPNPSFAVTLAQAATQVGAGALLVGATDRTFGSLTLPAELGFMNMPDCWLATDIAIALPWPIAAGSATVPLPIPNDPSLANAPLFSQWFLIDPGANPFGAVMTQGGRVLVR